MKLLELIRSQLIVPRLAAAEKFAAIRELVDFMAAGGAFPAPAREPVLGAVYGRERFMSTGMEHGIALPHGVSEAVDDEVAAIGLSPQGIPFDSFDGRPAQIVILLVTPTQKAITRVRTLAEIARVVNERRVREALVKAETVEQAVDVLRGSAG